MQARGRTVSQMHPPVHRRAPVHPYTLMTAESASIGPGQSFEAPVPDVADASLAYFVGGAMTVWQPVSTLTVPPVETEPQAVLQRRISLGLAGLS